MSARTRSLLVLQHAGCEPPGVYEDEIHDREIPIERVVLDEARALPDWRAHAGIVAMGGAIGAYEEQRYPWLVPEKRLIAEAVLAGTPYWGVCLGAQLLASALGGDVTRGPAPELGVMDVTLTQAAAVDPVFGSAPPSFRALQWHGDTYELPPGATQLARSRSYEQQAFCVGRAYGLQFHLEVDGALAASWMGIPDYVSELEQLDGPGAGARMVEQVRAAEAETVPLARSLFARWLVEVAGL